ncbi:MAG: GGDEF domain-containing protein [Pseudomonadota bacterium]
MKKVIPFDSAAERSNKRPSAPIGASAATGVAADVLSYAGGSEQQLLLLQRLIGRTTISELLDRYFAWLSDLRLADGLTYAAPQRTDVIALGNRRHHSAQYEVTIDKEVLGDLSFCRRERFSEDELMIIEQSLAFFARCLKTAHEVTQLRSLATHDPLTGLLNRNALSEWVDTELKRTRRHGSPLTVMMIDVDHFKTLNDQLGHLVGDRILRAMASVFRHGMRGSDLVFRFGGDEFAILLPHTDVNGATRAANLIRSNLSKLTDNDLGLAESEGSDLDRPGVSIGIAAYKAGDDEESLLRRADTHLYHAKALGRGRTCSAL